MRVHIINGPNLNLLGRREPGIYGTESFDSTFERLREEFSNCDLSFFQSNHEGELVTNIQSMGFEVDYIVLNSAAYAHTSIAIADAVTLVPAKVIEVHISNVYAREEFRHYSYASAHTVGSIVGLGMDVYALAILACLRAGK